MLTSADPEVGRISTLRASLMAAARQYGTPLYVLDMACVSAAAAQVESAFPKPWLLHYSLKANDLPGVVAFLYRRGWSASVVSTGEWQQARYADVPNESLAFEGIGKTDAQLEYAVQEASHGRPLRWLALESADEAIRLQELAARYDLGTVGPPADVLVRLNPGARPETRTEFAVGVGNSKFGLSFEEILQITREGVLSGPALRLRGVHVHVGSELRDVAAWANAGVQATRLLAELRELVPSAETLDTIDFGGGFPLASGDGPLPAQFSDALSQALRAAGLALPARPAIEPGRFLVGDAGWLVASVLHWRTGRHPGQQAVIDAGMTELIRPALYGSRHRVHALRTAIPASAAGSDTALEGPVCESTDSFGTHRLPRLSRGDLIAIEAAGAYAASFTSRYNGRPQPTEALLWADGSLQRSDRPPIKPLERDLAGTSATYQQEPRSSPSTFCGSQSAEGCA